MTKSKYIRTILILIGAMILISLSVITFNRPATTDASFATLLPRVTNTPDQSGAGDEDSDDDDDDDELLAGIYGQVIDLSTGQPGQGLEIDINGSIVRTDTDGRYSLTGLQAGTYEASVRLPNQATAAQSSKVVHLAEQETVTLDLTYYSQTPPSPTPTETPPPSPTSTPTPASLEATTKDTGSVTSSSDNFSPLTPSTGGDPAVWINPGHVNNEEGVSGHLAVDVANVSDLGAFQAILKFNPKVIQIDDVVLGNFLDSTGRQTKPLVTEIDNTTGEISFVAFTSGDTAGPDGGGTLAVIDFSSKQPGLSELELEDVRLVARLGKTIDARIGDGQVNVIDCFGDLNDDQIIDVGDIQAASGRAGQSLGDPNYVLEFDLNNDNVIDDEDVIMITDRLHETCP